MKSTRCTCGGQSTASHGGASGCRRANICRKRSRDIHPRESNASALRRCRITSRAAGPEVGSWKLEGGGWKLEVGGWKLQFGGSKLEADRRSRSHPGNESPPPRGR